MLSTVIGSLTPLSDDLAESMTAEFSLLTPLSRLFELQKILIVLKT
jgi:hypothetical protein